MTTTQPAPRTATLRFPEGFLWGTATSAYQVEGSVDADGRSPSIWDTFAHTPGAVAGGDHGDVACDHYRRMPDDVALMGDLGVHAYRFSVSWPRVRPGGGAVEQRGLDFYRRLVDELLGAGITPWVTLYHWDLPQALQDAGGWLHRDTAHRFADYAQTVHDALGDRVPFWTTLNEPWCSAFLGHSSGEHAPGMQAGAAGLVAAHHLLLAHGLAATALRAAGVDGERSQLGITLNLTVADPFDPTSEADVRGARDVDLRHNRVFLDPLLRHRYPTELFAQTETLAHDGRPWQEVVRPGDLSVIGTPIDLLGVNYYHGDAVSASSREELAARGVDVAPATRPTPYVGCDDLVLPLRPLPRTGLDWEVQPEGLTRLLTGLDRDYDLPPVYVTENGAAYPDTVSPDGTVDDPERWAYVAAHLRAVHAAVEQGVDVRGYFCWTLMDNFEWGHGYGQRFGLVHVDYETQARTPKTSAGHYAAVVRDNGLDDGLDDGPEPSGPLP